MRTVLLLCGIALVAVGCSQSPVANDPICPPGSGVVIRTGADGQPEKVCEANQ